MELNLQIKSEQLDVHFSSPKSKDNEVISFKECKAHLEQYGLDDERINNLKNNVEGIVNTIISAYLETFK
jgi:hypothetical protein